MWIYYRLYFNTVPGAYQTKTEFASRFIPLSPFNEKLDSHGRSENHLSHHREIYLRFPEKWGMSFCSNKIKQKQMWLNLSITTFPFTWFHLLGRPVWFLCLAILAFSLEYSTEKLEGLSICIKSRFISSFRYLYFNSV